jgi:WD40 repeat protein
MSPSPTTIRKWLRRLGVVLLLPLAIAGADRLIPPRPRLSFTLPEGEYAEGLSPDGSTLATNDGWRDGWSKDPGTLRLWDLNTGRPGAVLQNADDVVGWFLSFSPDSRLLCADAKASIRVWDVASGIRLGELKNPDGDGLDRFCSGFSSDSRFVVLQRSSSGKLKRPEGKELWDPGLTQFQDATPNTDAHLDSGGPRQRLLADHRLVSPDGRWAAEERDGGMDLWDMVTGDRCGRLMHPGDRQEGYWSDFSKDSRFLLTPVLRSQMATAQPFDEFPSLKNPLGFSHIERVVRLWEVETRREAFTFLDCGGTTLSQDGQTLVTSHDRHADHQIMVWDLPPRKPWWAAPALGTALWALVLCTGFTVRRGWRWLTTPR